MRWLIILSVVLVGWDEPARPSRNGEVARELAKLRALSSFPARRRVS